MVIQKQEAFLDKLAATLGRERRTEGVERPIWSVSPQLEVYQGFDQDDLVDVLEKQCAIIHTDFRRTDKAGLANVLKEVIIGYEGKSIIVAKDPRNKDYGLDGFYEKLQQVGREVHEWDATKGKENQVFAERADIGINFSDMTLAESATITLFNNKDNGRSISLLPRTWIAIIPKSTLVPRMTQVAKHIHEATQQGHAVSSCVSFISGPSNSADIEMNLIVGVHGPIKVTYIVVD
ncbi:LutC/YkgG family protein [Sporosarcina limicola]|uniref:Lactate utilization protein C n=1 Tax=Sporosarcina limicola TaxID=34101 RepID=A0A927R5F0_9BACL|nr:lactate utilization protein C [Sporosarcina limicola]MBE1555963.1 L-lactate dehydrogenase complex protein LldG [Sporosarcina limicola]